MTKNFKILILSCFFVTLLILGNLPLKAADNNSIKLGYLPATGHGKLFVTKERGYFDDEGLQVELIEFINSADGIAAIRAGKADIGGFGTVAPLLHNNTGADFRIIGGLMGQDASIITTEEKAPSIKSIKDLKGKKVATVRLATGDAVLRGAIHDAGLSWKTDLEISELKSPGAVIEAVKGGQVDLGVVWGPHDVSAINQGLKVVLVSANLFPGHPCCRLTVVGEEFNNRSDTWVKFLRAVLKGERFAQSDDPKQQNQTIVDISKYAKLDPELIKKSYYEGYLDQSTDPNASGVLKMWKIMNDAEYVTSGDDVSRFIETGVYQQALDSLLAEEPNDEYWKKLKTVFDSRNQGTFGGGRTN
jgi:NitT/TauT family transport system substrate-binding protein